MRSEGGLGGGHCRGGGFYGVDGLVFRAVDAEGCVRSTKFERKRKRKKKRKAWVSIVGNLYRTRVRSIASSVRSSALQCPVLVNAPEAPMKSAVAKIPGFAPSSSGIARSATVLSMM